MQGAFSSSEVATAKDINYWAGFLSEWTGAFVLFFPLTPLFLPFCIHRLFQLRRLRSGNSKILEVERRYKGRWPRELKRELADEGDLLAIAKLRSSYQQLLLTVAISTGAFILVLAFFWVFGFGNVFEAISAVVTGHRDGQGA